jgi:hypothetical protein
VSKSTNKLIPSIIGPGALTPLTDLVLANAIYFKGRWEKPFDKRCTKEDKFHRLDGTHVACHDGFKVLQLRYEQGSRPLLPQLVARAYFLRCLAYFLRCLGNLKAYYFHLLVSRKYSTSWPASVSGTTRHAGLQVPHRVSSGTRCTH